MQYINENIIVLVSGCNIIFYNFQTKEQKFIQRKTAQRRITYLSVGHIKSQKNNEGLMSTTKFKFRNTIYNYNNNNSTKNFDLKDILICVGEYSDKEELFYVNVFRPFSSSYQYIIKSTEKKWIINFTTILNNFPYCVAISQKADNNKNGITTSRISFMKYSHETFICQETISEDLIYCCYNPKNTIELVLCGKGYLRLWNVFINEGTLKEHQQRFLKGKQEKEKTFIKAQFFDKKPFLLIVGTWENIFYIIDSFQVIHELNVNYSIENIYDLNVQNYNNTEEIDDIIKLKKSIDSINNENIDKKLREITLLSNNLQIDDSNEYKKKTGNNNNIANNTNYNNNGFDFANKKNIPLLANKTVKDEVFKRLYKSKKIEINDGKIIKSNGVKFFELINDNLLFVIYNNDGCTLLYKIDWNRKLQEGEPENNYKKWKADECRIIRIATNIKCIYGYSFYKPGNDIILIVESFPKKKKNEVINININENENDIIPKTNISLYKLKKSIVKEQDNQSENSLTFEFELFNGFFDETEIKFIELGEKKQNIYLIDDKNVLNCFDILNNKYVIKHSFQEKVNSLSVNPIKNLFAISFPTKVCIYGNLKNKCHLYCDLAVEDSIIKWSIKGDFLVVAGKNRDPERSKSYCIYFVEAENFDTLDVIENDINIKIEDLKLIDNDKYLFLRLSSSYICGMFLNLYNNCSSLIELSGKSISTNYFRLIFTYNPKGNSISSFEYDSGLKLLIAIESENKILRILSNNSKAEKDKKSINCEISCNLTEVKLIKELNLLIGGDNTGGLKIFSWPFKGYESNEIRNINENLISIVNLDLGSISSIINFKNYSSIITLTSNSSVFINNLLIARNNDFKTFEYFSKGTKPQIELLINPYNMYDIKKEDILTKEKNAYLLDEMKEVLKNTMKENKKYIENLHINKISELKNSIKQINEDEKKYDSNDDENKEIKEDKKDDLELREYENSESKTFYNNRHEEKIKIYDNEIERLKIKLDRIKIEMSESVEIYENKKKEKITIYDNEIERLKAQLHQIAKSIEEIFDSEVEKQKEFYQNAEEKYNKEFDEIKKKTKNSLNKLVNISCEYDEATDQIVKDYTKLKKNLEEKINEAKERNTRILLEKENKLDEAKKKEDEHKLKLEEKVKDSDKLIEKNVEIKQNIINATQRTITFQEQLLETEKNLVKIDKKLEDLVVKNKHLEQIRFVLEHRMTSLEKEKAPLEGQCSFLENQKNKLTEEFNKIILQINKNNQELENKQSQLRASLIQNYEIHDQKNYVEAKLIQLKTDIEQFLQNYQEKEDEKPLSDNKATKVALNFKQFYDKYFSTSIEDELLNYQYYSQKLQEQTDKDGIANNFDLIMRNKAEEKLICEKQKVEELKIVKENGFKRIQNENTILITECNRLRKNLHEIYMHVIDIEQRFEALTNINPKLSKSDIVGQIKEFIRITHEKIKENYAQTKKTVQGGKKKKFKKSQSMKKIVTDRDFNKIIEKNMNNNKIINRMNEIDKNKIEDDNKNPYVDIIKKKGMKKKNGSFVFGNNNIPIKNINKLTSKGSLPYIKNK